MSRPRTPLAQRIARLADVDPDLVQSVLDDPSATSSNDPCWPWSGSCHRLSTPVIKHEGRPQSVRRVIYAAQHGGCPDDVRLKSICPTWRCVNPAHARAEQVRQTVEADDDEPATTVEQAAEFIYLQEDIRDPELLADISGFPLSLIEQALAGIEAGTL